MPSLGSRRAAKAARVVLVAALVIMAVALLPRVAFAATVVLSSSSGAPGTVISFLGNTGGVGTSGWDDRVSVTITLNNSRGWNLQDGCKWDTRYH
jgi:hypothetical protein